MARKRTHKLIPRCFAVFGDRQPVFILFLSNLSRRSSTFLETSITAKSIGPQQNKTWLRIIVEIREIVLERLFEVASPRRPAPTLCNDTQDKRPTCIHGVEQCTNEFRIKTGRTNYCYTTKVVFVRCAKSVAADRTSRDGPPHCAAICDSVTMSSIERWVNTRMSVQRVQFPVITSMRFVNLCFTWTRMTLTYSEIVGREISFDVWLHETGRRRLEIEARVAMRERNPNNTSPIKPRIRTANALCLITKHSKKHLMICIYTIACVCLNVDSLVPTNVTAFSIMCDWIKPHNNKSTQIDRLPAWAQAVRSNRTNILAPKSIVVLESNIYIYIHTKTQ